MNVMSDYSYLLLYPRNPEDLAEVVDFAHEVTDSSDLVVTSRFLSWGLLQPGVDYEEITRKIACRFPHISFVLVYEQISQMCWTEFEWDGNEWKEMGWYSEYEEAGTDNEKSFLHDVSLEPQPAYVSTFNPDDFSVSEEDEDLPF